MRKLGWIALFGLALAVETRNLRRNLQTAHPVVLYIALEYVNNDVASQLESGIPNEIVLHFCQAVIAQVRTTQQ